MIIVLPLNQNQKTFLFEDEKLSVIAKIDTTKLDNGLYVKILFIGFYNNEPCDFLITNPEHENSALRVIFKFGEWASVITTDDVKFKASFAGQI